ncbi:hypothetical protein [Chitinophaga polysaccharea]|uniref:hypothetical protein n=1 Tax=Chitinophaga polysaccharea TaxID=1293035 RepID=UPI001158E81C|nr:hypothetical protein [Chitinophaga polysaccharea]
MRRFILLGLFIAFLFFSGKIVAQSNCIVPPKIKSALELIASSAMDSATFGQVHFFNIGIVLNNAGMVKEVKFSDDVEPDVERTIRKTIRENKIDWKAIFTANNIKGNIYLLVPVFYGVELPEKPLTVDFEDIAKKFKSLFTFKNLHRYDNTIIVEPNIYTGNIYY